MSDRARRDRPSSEFTDVSDGELFELHREKRNRQVRNELVQRHMGLAYHLAGRYAGRGQERDDLNQAALAGLVKAVDRFDPSRGVPFAAYASVTIEGTLKRYFRDFAWGVHTPRSITQMSGRVRRAIADLEQRLGASPSPADVAAHLDVSVDDVVEVLAANTAFSPDSLDAPAPGDDERGHLGALGGPDREMARSESRMAVEQMLRLLDDRERTVVQMRFFDDLTQAQIGERIGVSQMHVSRILRRAVEFLREQSDEHGVQDAPQPKDEDLDTARFAIPVDPAYLGPGRDEASEWLESRGISPDDRANLLLIWSELATNAIQQGPESPILIELTMSHDEPEIRLRVSNDAGRGAQLPPRDTWRSDDPLALRGRGLAIVDGLCRRVEWMQRDGRTTVTAHYVPARQLATAD